MALSLRRSAPARAKVINERLVANLRAATDQSAVIDALEAIGNSGHPSTLPALRPHLLAADESVRAAAVAALRWNPSQAAEKGLLKALDKDKSVRIRGAVISAYGFRPVTTRAETALARAALNDPSSTVRIGAMNDLYRVRFRRPEVLDVVRKVAAQDKDAEVQKAARELLALHED